MTAELEYSYLNDDFALQISEELMTRAVRVKKAVRDKVERIFKSQPAKVVEKKEPTVENSEVEATVKEPEVEVSGLESMIDLSEENLKLLNSKITALQNQKEISHTVRRAVLFTSALKDKIARVNSNWFKDMPVEEKSSVLPEEVKNINHLGGEVVPGTWDDKVVDSKVTQAEPTEFVPSFVPEQTDLNASSTVGFVSEPQAIPLEGYANTEVQVPEIPTFPVEEENNEVEKTAEASELEKTAEIRIPTELVSEEQTVQAELPAEPVPEVKPKKSIEDRIAEMLNRKNETAKIEGAETKEVGEASVDENADRQMADNNPPLANKTDVLARLHRIKTTMQDKDAQISKLSSKLEASNNALDEAKDKINGYETVLDDLTVKCNSLTQANEQLTTKNAEMESTYGSRITTLESQVNELRQSKAEEAEASSKIINDLKEKHAQEIEELKARHAQELSEVEASKERQINAIYATITEALGEPTEEYTKAA